MALDERDDVTVLRAAEQFAFPMTWNGSVFDIVSQVRQGFVEKSNVSSVLEMSRMIEVTRAYTSISAMLQQQGDMRKSALDKLADVPA